MKCPWTFVTISIPEYFFSALSSRTFVWWSFASFHGSIILTFIIHESAIQYQSCRIWCHHNFVSRFIRCLSGREISVKLSLRIYRKTTSCSFRAASLAAHAWPAWSGFISNSNCIIACSINHLCLVFHFISNFSLLKFLFTHSSFLCIIIHLSFNLYRASSIGSSHKLNSNSNLF